MIDPKRIVSVIGAGTSDPKLDRISEEIGRLLARESVAVVCGGLGGVMEAACRGAKSSAGLTIGILPGSDPSTANPWVDIPIPTGMGEARNAIVIRTGKAVIAVGGEYGTLSEIAFALKLGVPLIGINTWQLGKADGIRTPFPQVQTADEAVAFCLTQIGPNR